MVTAQQSNFEEAFSTALTTEGAHRYRALEIECFNRRIIAEDMSRALDIPIEEIDFIDEGAQSRQGGGDYATSAEEKSHLMQVSQTIANRLQTGRSTLDVPIVVRLHPNPDAPQKYIVVLGNHRIRGFVKNGLKSIPAIIATFSDPKTLRRFQKYNNDPEAPAKANSEDDLLKEIDDSILEAIELGYDPNDNKKDIIKLVTTEVSEVVANNWSKQQVALRVNNWFDKQDDTFYTPKVKAYTCQDAIRLGAQMLGGQYAKLEKSGNAGLKGRHVLYSIDVDSTNLATYLGYLMMLQGSIANHNANIKVGLVLRHRTAKISDYETLVQKRADAARSVVEMLNCVKRLGIKKVIVDKAIFLPQYMAEGSYKEDECAPIPCPL
tara:strand:+ start:1740 stop:2876 length:1137 start_codon:yes stop_codon:yes gene_type:complete